MNPRWQYINLCGVLLLAGLCVWQWQRDRRLNLEFNRLEQNRQAQEKKITEQEQAARGLSDDLARFKEQFTQAKGDLDDTLKKVRLTERTNELLLIERDQLRESVTNWAAAVTLRDERLLEANSRIRDLGSRLDDSIQKFNALATNYNAVVKDLNELRAKAGTTVASNFAQPK